jgi:hypothetical protein
METQTEKTKEVRKHVVEIHMETHTDIIQENESKIIKVDKEIMTEKKTYKEIEIETDFCMNEPSKN